MWVFFYIKRRQIDKIELEQSVLELRGSNKDERDVF